MSSYGKYKVLFYSSGLVWYRDYPLTKMCVIDPRLYEHSGRVKDVASTRLLVSPENNRPGRQLTVYSNRVALDAGTQAVAMILPVPNPGNVAVSVRVIDTSDDKGKSSALFDRLRPLVSKPPPDDRSSGLRGQAISKSSSPTPSLLPVERAGAYAYTLVPSIDDFGRVRGDMLPRPPSAEVMQLLRDKYEPRSFSFLVCKMDAGDDAQYHPLAYTHPVLRKGNLFVPTLHYHGDEVKNSTEEEDLWSLLHRSGGRGADREQDIVQAMLRKQRESELLTERPNYLRKAEETLESKRFMFAMRYDKCYPDYDVEQDEDADVFIEESPELPHWDHEIYMFGVSPDPDEKFGRRTMACKQDDLDRALREVPASYASALGRHQDRNCFRFRRMLGKRFANEDIVLRQVATA